MLTIIGGLLPLATMAQGHGPASAALDRSELRIGEQAVVTLRWSGGAGVAWPLIGDTLSTRIEVVRRAPIDTAEQGAVLEQRITVTSFDTGYWAIPPFRFGAGQEVVESAPLLLHVLPYAVDSLALPKEPKPIHAAPFSLSWWIREHAAWIAGALAIALAAALALVLVRRMKNRQARPVEVAPLLPLHERYLLDLDALERERLWQQGEHKAYQSRLTDLLRGYIEERYQVPALERTTDELMQELKVSPLSLEQQSLLANALRSADLVKFAKALPSPQENEQLMAAARRLIRETAPPPPVHAKP